MWHFLDWSVVRDLKSTQHMFCLCFLFFPPQFHRLLCVTDNTVRRSCSSSMIEVQPRDSNDFILSYIIPRKKTKQKENNKKNLYICNSCMSLCICVCLCMCVSHATIVKLIWFGLFFSWMRWTFNIQGSSADSYRKKKICIQISTFKQLIQK